MYPFMCQFMCHRMNGLGYCGVCGDELGGGLFIILSLLVILVFSYFHNILFYGVYHSMEVDSTGVVLIVHIWWEFNAVNSKYGGIWAMLQNMAGDPACNGL